MLQISSQWSLAQALARVRILDRRKGNRTQLSPLRTRRSGSPSLQHRAPLSPNRCRTRRFSWCSLRTYSSHIAVLTRSHCRVACPLRRSWVRWIKPLSRLRCLRLLLNSMRCHRRAVRTCITASWLQLTLLRDLAGISSDVHRLPTDLWSRNRFVWLKAHALHLYRRLRHWLPPLRRCDEFHLLLLWESSRWCVYRKACILSRIPAF